MKNNLKNEVIGFLANLPNDKYEQFNKAFELYRKSTNKNFGIERRLNTAGFSEEGLKNLIYDLQQVFEIKDTEIMSYAAPQEEAIALGEVTDLNLEPNPEQGLLSLVPLSLGEEKIVLSEEAALTNEKQKLREEFPFLDAKDCPDVMHVVVGRKIAAYNRYVKLHAQATAIANDDASSQELEGVVKDAEESFSENRALYDELNHYKENGEILGKHSLFFELVAKKEVEGMSNEDMHKFKNSSATFFSRKKTELKKHEKDLEKVATINESIAQRELKLKFVDARLGIKNE